MGFGGCWCPSSTNVSQMAHHSFTLINIAPNSASPTDDATNFKMVQKVKISLLTVMGSLYLGTEPRKKWTDARLLQFLVER